MPIELVYATAAGAAVGLAVHAAQKALTASHPPKDGTAPARLPAAATVLLCAAVGLLWGWRLSESSAVTALLAVVAVPVVVGALVDARTRRIPNRLTHPCAVVGVAAAAASAVLPGASLVGAASALVVLPLLLLVLRAGMGDVKLAVLVGGVAGAASGPFAALLLFGAMALSGAAVALLLLATRQSSLAARVPYGPHIAVAFVVAPLVG